jgi:hypothetical protein
MVTVVVASLPDSTNGTSMFPLVEQPFYFVYESALRDPRLSLLRLDGGIMPSFVRQSPSTFVVSDLLIFSAYVFRIRPRFFFHCPHTLGSVAAANVTKLLAAATRPPFAVSVHVPIYNHPPAPVTT